jgi:cytochrome c oxidase assembly protein subunit 11
MTGRRASTLAWGLGGVALAMVGLAYASVPLYKLFCQVTGFAGTPSVAATAPAVMGERVVTVRFNADVQSNLPWRFQPAQAPMRVRVGEPGLAFYRAENLSDSALVGTASFNVTPLKAGAYFTKVECFCFREQVLGPGQSADLAVSFFIDPAIAEDPDMADVHTITLSYMFFDAGADALARAESILSGAARTVN